MYSYYHYHSVNFSWLISQKINNFIISLIIFSCHLNLFTVRRVQNRSQRPSPTDLRIRVVIVTVIPSTSSAINTQERIYALAKYLEKMIFLIYFVLLFGLINGSFNPPTGKGFPASSTNLMLRLHQPIRCCK